jgi:hypothetical protein
MKKPPFEAVFFRGSEGAARQLLKLGEGWSADTDDAAFFSGLRTVKGHAGRCGPAGSGLPVSTPCACGPARLATCMPD